MRGSMKMKTATETNDAQKSTPMRQARIHKPDCLYPERTIEKHMMSWNEIAKPHPTPKTRAPFTFSLMKNEPKERPTIELRSTPIIRRTVTLVSSPRKLAQMTPIVKLKIKIMV